MAETQTVHAAPLPASMSPELRQFREYVRTASDEQLDAAYRHFVAALPEHVGSVDYHTYVTQLESRDPNERANGICGVAAAKTPASLDHLVGVFERETDPFNRTMIVWCLRTYDDDPRVSKAFEAFWARAKDVDFQRVLGPSGEVHYIRFPWPLVGAAYEAFKGLVAIRGRDYMLSGAGWPPFAQRFDKHVDPEPIGAIDMQRFQSDRPRFDPYKRAQEWIDEMKEE